MQNDIWLAIKHIKQGSKKNVTFAKIEQFTKRNKVEISTEELNRIIENSVDNVIQMQGKSQNATCRFSEQAESEDVLLMSHTQEPSSSSSQNERVNFTQNGDGEVVHGSTVSESNNNIEQGPMNAVRKDITSLKCFQEPVAKKLSELEEALIIFQQINPNSSIGSVGTGDENCNCNDKSDFVLNLLKSRITNLENEILKIDAIIDYLAKQIFASKSTSHQ